ncbi:hypothetical protein C8R45DRAFT_1090760 [Mycena sanguinolenta]|nr:hypothetical protein C8R45DRAFT_1090760 [Mycena sanguinolenta]
MQFKALASIVALSAIVSVNARPGATDICLKICAPQELCCADGWHSQKFGANCNTCCKDEENSVKSVKAEDVCLKACFFEEAACPQNFTARKLRGCWTCCLDVDDSSLASSGHTQVQMCKDI